MPDKKRKEKRRYRNLMIVAAVCAAFAVSGWGAYFLKTPQATWENEASSEIHEGTNELINPLLECVTAPAMGGAVYKELEDSLKSAVTAQVRAGGANEVSIYFRDLNNGPWIGIDEDRRFAPGSMLKVPLMMAYYRLAESRPSVLEDKIKFVPFEMPGGARISQDVDSAGQLVRGLDYTTEELLANMIIYSDNSAAALLWEHIDQESRDSTYLDLGLKVPLVTDWMANVISVKDFASFLRVLYNASYLGRSYSRHALEMLSKTSFRDGLVAGLPVGTKVAHKFGIRFKDGTTLVQLHDCGIIYLPGRPYLLCVMTKGNSLQRQGETIAHISRTVHNTMSKIATAKSPRP